MHPPYPLLYCLYCTSVPPAPHGRSLYRLYCTHVLLTHTACTAHLYRSVICAPRPRCLRSRVRAPNATSARQNAHGWRQRRRRSVCGFIQHTLSRKLGTCRLGNANAYLICIVPYVLYCLTCLWLVAEAGKVRVSFVCFFGVDNMPLLHMLLHGHC